MTISERIFERLRQLFLSQKEFAELTGIKQSTVSEWKKNKTNPSSDKILDICRVLDVSPEWLIADHSMDAQTVPDGVMKVSIADAARLLGKSQQFLRVALQRGAAPFGFAVKMPSGKWSYHISPSKLAAYVNGAA